MSLLTRCPACETLYKLVPDQLRISQGWVKCGQCAEIFDASQHLIQMATASETVLLSTPAPHVLGPAPCISAVNPSTEHEDGHQDGAAATPNPEAETNTVETNGGMNYLPPVPDVEPFISQQDQGAPNDSILDDVVIEKQQQQVLADIVDSPDPAPNTLGKVESIPETVSFLVGSDNKAVWHTRMGKVVLSLLAISLIVAAVIQWLYWERDRLVATNPQWRPLLQQFCQHLNCSVRAMQRIESVVIDAATFNKLGVDGYRLSFNIKNLSGVTLAMPSVELTLTDSQERILVRRVLSRQDLLVVSDDLPAGSELPVTVVMRIRLNEALPRAMGYRLLAFYPD